MRFFAFLTEPDQPRVKSERDDLTLNNFFKIEN